MTVAAPVLTLGAPALLALEKVADADAHEGPVYVAAEHALYFTTPRRGRVAIQRLDLGGGTVSVVRADANNANGMTLDAAGRLVVCEQGSFTEPARITRLDPATGAVETLADRGLSSPNDVVVAPDGAIWLTDPSYGFLQGFRPRSASADRVWRLEPESGELTAVADTVDKPNGLALTPDGRTLYVADSGADHGPDDYDPARNRRVVAFDVEGAVLANERVVADKIPGYPDGLKLDAEGRLYVSSSRGVEILAPTGERLDLIDLPGAVNFCFGGPALHTLYVTADTAVWAALLDTEGARP
ncbi:MAG TPA: SMP-30/gluconolactonase/LRE family protein [Gaiellaceae bacterium]|nr:SMP-30/gluconolactonase/LRE family protein [Gaiellaceae bacterium]